MLNALFYTLVFITLGSALLVAAGKNLVRSVFLFFVTLFGLAGLYVLSMADFVAVTQIVIYVGGILILIVFAFMLSGRETLAVLNQPSYKLLKLSNLPALLIAGLFFMAMANTFYKAKIDSLPWVRQSQFSHNMVTNSAEMTQNIGINLMTRYLLPFEMMSVLLLMALIGAAHLSRKEDLS